MTVSILGVSMGIFMVAFVLFILVMSLAGMLLTIYAFYDIVFVQERMQTAEKLIWIGIVLFLNLPGVIIYLLLVKHQGEYIMDEKEE